ncbi:carotenoid biosynthesis protein [Deminuibacter soli]|uniref:carotenoid biosynthesis protein n=1 Tax=Deminuibacter soli TaxID=2291815 RepID=UPI001314967C|nr:carotenoid biosynthesis protein [Deminuibacter soli]
MNRNHQRNNNIALGIALLFHISGLIGLFTSARPWFIRHTPLNLWLMAILLLFTHHRRHAGFWLFAALAFVTGMVTEIVGINTGLLFGQYVYTPVLGLQYKGVPLLIGVNWLVIVYCCGTAMEILQHRLARYYAASGLVLPKRIQTLSVIADGALLAVLFDWVMEPAAVKLGFWTWAADGEIPMLNYGSWLVVSLLLLVLFRRLRVNCNNYFAIHLLIIEALFFLVIRTFL